MIALAVLAGASAAVAAGYVARRWQFVAVVAVLGIAIITVDVITRDLASGGHDDRGFVALAEFMMLVGTLVLLAAGVAVRRWGDRHRKGRHRRPGSRHA